MKALIQRVTEARVEVNSQVIGQIQQGMLVFVGVDKDDSIENVQKLLHKLLNYRIFADENGKMNNSLKDIKGGLLLVSQFTLVADTKSGLRPSFSTAASPVVGQQVFNELVKHAKEQHAYVETGCFGADMQVYLVNDGPVTFWLSV